MKEILTDKFYSLKLNEKGKVKEGGLVLKIIKENNSLLVYPTLKQPISTLIYILLIIISYFLIIIPISIIASIIDFSNILDTNTSSISLIGAIYISAYKFWFVWLIIILYVAKKLYNIIERKLALFFYSKKWNDFINKNNIKDFIFYPTNKNNDNLMKLINHIDNNK